MKTISWILGLTRPTLTSPPEEVEHDESVEKTAAGCKAKQGDDDDLPGYSPVTAGLKVETDHKVELQPGQK